MDHPAGREVESRGGPGLPGGAATELAACLEESVYVVLTDPAFEAAAAEAGRTLVVADATTTRQVIDSASQALVDFAPILAEGRRRIRS